MTSIVQSNNKVKVYTEDAEARWFLSYLITDYLVYIDMLNSTIGCDSLINLYCADLAYFGNTLVVLDGDVVEAQLQKIPDPIRNKLGNIIILPGNNSPEKILYEYLIELKPEHDFWRNSYGFTWDYFKDHGPLSDDYKGEKEREKYKKWFIAHKPFFESAMLMDFWLRDNPDVVSAFKKEFLQTYSRIAKRTAASEMR